MFIDEFNTDTVIELPDVEPGGLQILLNWAHTGAFDVEPRWVNEALKAAGKYKVVCDD